jgi:hypothetical protein
VPGGDVPQVFGDLAADGLGQAGVEGAAHPAGLHRPQVLDVDHSRPGGEGLVGCPAGGGPGEGVVQARPAVRDTAGLVAEDRDLRHQGVVFAPGGEPLAVIEFGVKPFAVPAQAVRLGEDPVRPVLRARAERPNRPVRPQAHDPGGQEGVQPPVKPDRYRVPVSAGLRHRISEREVSPDPAAGDAQGGPATPR